VDKKAQEAYLLRVQNPAEVRALTTKEAELLSRLLNTEPAMRALAAIYWQARQIPMELIGLDFSEPKSVHLATRVQGQIQGVQNTIEALLEMTGAPTDEESGEPENE
jgi:hypothetical protein